MIQSKPDVLIIGSSFSAYAAYLACRDQEIVPTILDSWLSPSEPFHNWLDSESDVPGANLKTFFGSNSMYRYPEFIVDRKDLPQTPLSIVSGGLSSVWGAGSEFPSAESMGLSDVTGYSDACENISNHLKQFGFSLNRKSANAFDYLYISNRLQLAAGRFNNSKKYEASNPFLAFDQSLCVQCGECFVGCPTNSILNIAYQWKKEVDSFHRIEGIVTKINPLQSKINVDFLVPKTKELKTSSNYDFVFLATGSIATGSILLESSLISSPAKLSETQIYFTPIFSFRKKKMNDPKFTMAQLVLKNKDNNYSRFVSIFESGDYVSSRATIKISGRIIAVPRFLTRFFLVAISYLPEENSGKILIEKNHPAGAKLSALKKRNMKLSIFLHDFKIYLRMFSSGIIPISFLTQIPQIGSSYHIGHLTDTNGVDTLIEGKIPNLDNLVIVDGAAIPKLPVGSITAGILANSYRLAKQNLALKAF